MRGGDDYADLLAVGVPLDLCQPLRAGKLEQTCPACGAASAATWYCYKCRTATGPQAWHRTVVSEAQRSARQASGRRMTARAITRTKLAGRP
jgi:hypothetical protein